MGGSGWSKNCHTTHEGPTGSKCQKFDSQTQEDGDQASLETQASSIALRNETVVSEEHARLVAQQVDVHSVTNRQETSTGDKGIDVGQQLILQELQKMAKRFGALEEQAAKDREVLTGLVSQAKQQTLGQSQKKVTSLFSPEPVNATYKNTCQSNVAKQRHKSGPKTVGTSSHQQKGPQGEMHGGSLFHRDITDISIVSNSVNNTNPNGAGVSNIEQFNRCQIYDVSQPTAHTNQAITSSHPVCQQSSAMVTPTRIVTTESIIPSNLSYSQSQEGVRPKTVNCKNVGLSSQEALWQNDTNLSRAQPQSYGTNVGFSFAAAQNQAMEGRQTGNNTTSGRMTTQQATGASMGISYPLVGADQQLLGQEHVIPSLQSLHQSAHINDRVQQRYQELEEAISLNSQGNIELLLEALNQKRKNDKIKIKWPQDLAFIGNLRKRPTYEQLNTCQWLLGFLRIRQEETDPNIKENMIDYLTELMQDACDYTWDSAKGAHSVLLHRMADGVLTWSQIKEVHRIRKRYAQTVSTTNIQDKNSKSSKVVPCLKYNKGTCLRGNDHEWQNLLLKHMCQYCHSTFNKVEHHPRKDCWKAPKEHPKKLSIAANTAIIRTRYVYNRGVSKGVKHMLANAGNLTLRASRDKISRGLDRVYSRVVTNSSWKPPVLKNAQRMHQLTKMVWFKEVK